MLPLKTIDSLPTDAVDLLEAIGCLEAHEFCESDTQELHAEIVRANHSLKIIANEPTLDLLESWKKIACEAIGDLETRTSVSAEVASQASVDGLTEELGGEPFSGEISSLVSETVTIPALSSEGDPDVLSLLRSAPMAEPIPVALMKRHGLSVGDIDEGVLLADCQDDVDVKMVTASPEVTAQSSMPTLPIPSAVPRNQLEKTSEDRSSSEEKLERAGLMPSRIRSFLEAEEGEHHVKPLERGETRDVISLSKDLNAGLSPKSRRFVRGVLHPDPARVRSSAISAVLVQFFLVGSFLAIPAVIICDQFFEVPNVLWWLVGILVSLLLSTIGYLIWGIAARCRVCGQRQFSPKKCLKHRKAHHIRWIGYILPTALHAIFYKWFYCIYCGTAVRLKK